MTAYRLDLRRERGNDTVAAHHARRIEEIDGKLRAIEAAEAKQ